MEMNEIIKVVEVKAEEIAKEEIQKYCNEFPENNLTEEARNAVLVRAISQLTLQLSKFRFKDGIELDEQFNNWFETNEEDDLRKTCRHCLEDEVAKIKSAAKGSKSSLDNYLKQHLGDSYKG